MDIVRHKYIFLGISGTLVAAGMIIISVWGLRLGIDFTGGSLLEAEFVSLSAADESGAGEERVLEDGAPALQRSAKEGITAGRPDLDKIRSALQSLDLEGLGVQNAGANGVILRFRHVDEEKHQEIVGVLQSVAGAAQVKELRFDTIGPAVSETLKRRAYLALGISASAIVLYIAWAFRKVSEPVSSWKYGIAAVIALGHDVILPLAVFAVLGRWYDVPVDSFFITAMLTVMGFSVHDTIVIFDRIRENQMREGRKMPFESVINVSIRQTIARSVNTSLTVLLVLGAIYAFGGLTIRYFALALIIGVAAGTYSSIFLASPLLAVWAGRTGRG